MPVRIYQLYSGAAAAASLATVQIVSPCEILCINFVLYATVGNGVVSEVSTTAARQYQTNNSQGILALASVSNAAAGVAQLHANSFVPMPAGYKLKAGDIIYLHATQAGAGGTAQQSVSIYVRE